MIVTTPCEEVLRPFPQLKKSKLREIKCQPKATERADELKFDPQGWSHPSWAFPVLGRRATCWGEAGLRPTGPALCAALDGATPQKGDLVMPLVARSPPRTPILVTAH